MVIELQGIYKRPLKSILSISFETTQISLSISLLIIVKK
jgi:hypothetical protein